MTHRTGDRHESVCEHGTVEWVNRDEEDPGLGDWLKAVLPSVKAPAPARALFGEAVSCWQREDLDGAEKALRGLVASTQGDPRALAQFVLADLFGFRGDLADALLMLRLAAACGHREIAPAAACRLGEQLEEHGDIGSAERAYRQAINSGRGRYAFRARLRLSLLLYRDGDMRSAEELAREVLDSDIPELAGWAAGYIADIRLSRGDRDGAYSAFRQAAELDAGDAGDRATVMLAVLTDLGCGGASAREEYALLDRSEVAQERSGFIQATLNRWRGLGGDPRGLPLNPDWLRYYAASMDYYRREAYRS